MAGRKFTRSEMLDLVWSAPMRTVAAGLGLSDVGLKKAAQKAGIPTPPQGHWNKLAAGKKSAPKPSLPPRGFGASDNVWIGVSHWERYQYGPGPNDPIPPVPVFDEPMESVRRSAEKAVGRIAAPRDLATPHPAIREIIKDEAARAEKVKESAWMTSYYGPRFTAPIDQRRLRLLNAICLGLAKAGLRATLSNKEGPLLYVGSDDTSFPLIARKFLTKGKDAEGDRRLSVIAGSKPESRDPALAQWDDREDHKLEAMLTEIVIDLVVLVEQQYRDNQVRNHAWQIERRAAAIEAAAKAKIEAERRERERLEQFERERVERLLADAEKLRQAQAIRAYVAEGSQLYAS